MNSDSLMPKSNGNYQNRPVPTQWGQAIPTSGQPTGALHQYPPLPTQPSVASIAQKQFNFQNQPPTQFTPQQHKQQNPFLPQHPMGFPAQPYPSVLPQQAQPFRGQLPIGPQPLAHVTPQTKEILPSVVPMRFEAAPIQTTLETPKKRGPSIDIISKIDKLFSVSKKSLIEEMKLIEVEITKLWFSKGKIRDWFIKQLIDSGGSWEFSIDDENSEFLLKLLTNMLKKAPPEKRKSIMDAFDKTIQFFNFYSKIQGSNFSENSIVNGLDSTEIKKFIISCMNKTPSHDPELRLPLDFSLEVAESLFQLKAIEYHIFVPTLENLQFKGESYIPCYFIDQDNENIHLKCMRARFNTTLQGLCIDSERDAAGLLQSIIGNNKIDAAGRATITILDLQALRNFLEGTPGNKVPFLLVEGKKITGSQPSRSHSMDIETETSPPLQTLRRSQQSAPLKRQRGKGMEIPNFVKKRKTSQAKEAIEVKDVSNLNPFSIPDQSFRPSANPLVFKREAMELETSQTTQKRPLSDDTYKPIAGQTLNFEVEIDESLNQENLWKSLSLKSLQSVNDKIGNLSALKNFFDGKPLEYPVLELYEEYKANSPKVFPSCHKGLKGYQVEAVQNLLNYAKYGLSRLLSFEMGLGKTYVYAEYLAHQIAALKEGTQLVLLPKSLLDPIYRELQNFFSVVRADCWLMRAQSEPIDTLLWDYSKVLNNSLENRTDSEFTTLLKVFPRFKNEMLFNELSNLRFFNRFSVQNCQSAADAVNAHFNSLHIQRKANPEASERIYKNLVAIFREIRAIKFESSENKAAWEKIILGLKKEIESPSFTFPALNLQMKFSWPVVHEYCMLVGKILNLEAPALDPKAYYEGESLKALSTFDSNLIIKAKDPNDLTRKGSIILSTFGCAKQMDLSKVDHTTYSSVVADEAQKAHTFNSQMHAWFSEFIKKVSKRDLGEPYANILLVTATPFENNFSELQNLLALCNPGGFPLATHNALLAIYNGAEKSLRDAYDNPNNKKMYEKAKLDILKAFGYFANLRDTVTSFVSRVKKEDKAVFEAWNGMVPTRNDLTIVGKISDQTKKLFNEVEREFIESKEKSKKNIFTYTTKIKSLMVHPQLLHGGGFNLNNAEYIKIIDVLQNGLDLDKEAIIDNSPMLSSLFSSEGFMGAMRGGESVVIFTEHLVTAEILKHAINYKFKQYSLKKLSPLVRVFHGGLKDAERENMIDWFKKKSEEPKAFIVMQKAGGVGLNLPEAKKAFLLANDWNPGNTDQTIHRVLRVNNKGVWEIYTIAYNIFLEMHCTAVQDKKRAYETFFWNSADTKKKLFQYWCDVLLSASFHASLNTTRDEKKSLKLKNELQSILQSIQEGFSEENLIGVIDTFKPVVKARPKKVAVDDVMSIETVVQPPIVQLLIVQPPQRILNGNSYIPLPLASKNINKLSYDEAIACAYSAKNNPEVTLEISKLLQNSADLRQRIRAGQTDQDEKVKIYLDAIKEEKISLVFSNFEIEVYEFENGKYVCKDYFPSKEPKIETIQIYRKRFGTHVIFEPLVPTGR